MSSVAVSERGSASGMFSTLSRLSMIIGVIVFGILFSAGTGGESDTMINSMSHQILAQGFKIVYFASAGILFAGFVFSLARRA
jgi:hypothetical protein